MLAVSVSGYYAWLDRPPSARALRHAWLTEIIRQVHVDSRGTYGANRVHAELTLGRGLAVGREAVATLMRRSGLQGLSGRPRYRSAPNVVAASGPRRPPVRALRPRSALGHGHYRAPNPGRQDLLRGRSRHLQPASCGLVNRRSADRDAGDERTRHGHRATPTIGRIDCHSQRPRHPGWIQVVVATPS